MRFNDEVTQLIFSVLLAINPKATVTDLALFLNDLKSC